MLGEKAVEGGRNEESEGRDESRGRCSGDGEATDKRTCAHTTPSFFLFLHETFFCVSFRLLTIDSGREVFPNFHQHTSHMRNAAVAQKIGT